MHTLALPRRCPGTRDAMGAFSARRTLTAYALYEALMRAVSADPGGAGEAEAMQVKGLDRAVTPAALLGGREPSAPEEHLWFAERTRCRHCSATAFLGALCCYPAQGRMLGGSKQWSPRRYMVG